LVPPVTGAGGGAVTIGSNSVNVSGQTTFASTGNVGTSFNPAGESLLDTNIDQIISTTAQRKTAGAYFSGGVGIEQDLAVGGFIYGRISSALTATTSSQILTLATEVNDEFYPTFTNKLVANKTYPGINNGQDIGADYIYGDPTGTGFGVPITDETHISYNPSLGRLTLNNLHITSTATTTATNSGSVVVDGGVGIAKSLYVGDGIYPGSTATSTIGSENEAWATSYMQSIYTKFLGNSNGDIVVSPNNGVNSPSHGNGGKLDIFGGIRVRGGDPIGTAPVVSNTLYVTVDGSDTNDGRAQDPSRACRTISGAVNSPYYQPGTQILVNAGRYLEDNPIRMKPYTSVRGSDIRTTFIEPINKTQDLFHVDSGCYLNYMTFLNGRSGLLPGEYASGYNRGAYATAFPPLPPGEEIDLFHSPYIQNCTNLSGPWLSDGTMFVPNETVQVPFGVGTGSWPANTTTILISFENLPINGFVNAGVTDSYSTEYTGDLQDTTTLIGNLNTKNDLASISNPTLLDAYIMDDTNDRWVYTGAPGIELGQSINVGYKNPGFFDARTLMLANKPFIQWQVVSWVNQQILANASNPASSWYNFKYDQELCYRDVGILIENVAYDVTFGGNEKSIEAGLAYWKGVISVIADQITQTTGAIDYLRSLVQQVVVNVSADILPAVPQIPVAYQVINTVMTGGEVAIPSINSSFRTITTIIESGPSSAPDLFVSTGPDAAYISAEILLQANRKFIQENTINYINWHLITGGPNYLPYNKIKCARDTGLIIDSIAVDLLYPTPSYSQTTFAGLQYYDQNGYTGTIPDEISETVKAVSYLQQIATKIIQNRTAEEDALVGFYRYSNAVQITTTQPATASEVAYLNSEFGIINSILTGNTTGWTDYIIPNGAVSNLPSIQNAYELLILNINYMKEEVVAYVDAQGFVYDSVKCARDTGLIVDALAQDLIFNGTSQTDFAGIQYWNHGTYVGIIATELTTTTNAINYIKELAKKVVVNDTTGDRYSLSSQVTDLINVGTESEVGTIDIDFNVITDILTYGVDGITDKIIPNNLTTSTNQDVFNAYNLLIANKSYLKDEAIAYIEATKTTGFTYNQTTCRRDVGYIIDSVAFDLLYGGNRQAIQSGVYYWGYNASATAIPGEITQTVSAYGYLKTLVDKVVRGVTVSPTYQTAVKQLFPNDVGTSSEATTLGGLVDNIINIIQNGPGSVTKTPIGLTRTTSANKLSAAYALDYNKEFLKAEVIAYIDSQLNSFTYDRDLCKRDIGYIVHSVAFDLLHGGNRQAIQSGLSYYNQVGGVTQIPQETTATSQAFTFLGTLVNALITDPSTYLPYQSKVRPVTDLPLSNSTVTNLVTTLVNTLTNIISNGPTGYGFTPINTLSSKAPEVVNAYNIIEANRPFMVAETLAWIDYNYNNTSTFFYSQPRCERDTGLIVDAIGMDLMYDSISESTFAGLQYWSQESYTGRIESELTAVLGATNYVKTAVVALGITVGSKANANTLFTTVTNIISNGVTGVTNQVNYGGIVISPTIQADVNIIQAAKATIQTNAINYINSTYPDLVYDSAVCRRDIGFIIDSVCWDLLHSSNIQSIKSGVYYWGYNGGSVLDKELSKTIDAYNYMKALIPNVLTNVKIANPYQTAVQQLTSGTPATKIQANALISKIDVILEIIISGDTAGHPVTKIPQSLIQTFDTNASAAWNRLQANRAFIQAEVVAYVNATSNSPTFSYNQDLCYRDVGLMVDAVGQDVVLGGNQRSIEAGLSYWAQGYNYVANELTTITQAISFISEISKKIIANRIVEPITGTVATQVINTFFRYGEDYMPQQAVARGYQIISDIINKGPAAAPKVYAGGGLYSLTGPNGADTKISPTVTSIDLVAGDQYLIGLSEPAVGFASNSTLFFGNTRIFPLQDKQAETLSLQQTGSKNTWNQRKVDKIGGMGGALIDGAVISKRSPIQSFVFDAYTQLTQGGRGVRITNDGYAQLVSVFTVFSSVGVQVDNGGIASIVNSNANFGDLCLVAKGHGKRKFSGTVYNPPFRAYPFNPGKDGLDQYYPNGYWPYKGTVEVFVPDEANRPSISLVMEVVPPTTYKSEYNSPELASHGVVLQGFLNAKPSTGTLVAGTISLSDIDTTNVYVKNTVYVIDQFGYPYDSYPYLHDEFNRPVDENGHITTTNFISNPNYKIWYAETGTYVTDINFNSIVLNQPLTSGADFAFNTNYFTLYFCGNAYYTVQSSSVANSPYKLNQNILSANSDVNYQGPITNQISQHAASMNYLNTLVDYVVTNDNTHQGSYYQSTVTQVLSNGLTGGGGTIPFIDLRFGYLTTILTATNINSALSIVPPKEIVTTGVIPNGAGDAITLIKDNINFLSAEVYSFVKTAYPTLLNGSTGTEQQVKCQRDVELICQQLIYDLETGGNYNMVYSGLSYWSRSGTYHVIELGEAVTNTALFPDGATVNFYQRSYISASGYVFEYVGAGSNYGALPQRGQADPIQKRETVELDGGKVFFTSTDQNGDFRIGPSLVISQATGVISGRTFVQSLYANMTPFILAIE
jgi:hypothetical protein